MSLAGLDPFEEDEDERPLSKEEREALKPTIEHLFNSNIEHDFMSDDYKLNFPYLGGTEMSVKKANSIKTIRDEVIQQKITQKQLEKQPQHPDLYIPDIRKVNTDYASVTSKKPEKPPPVPNRQPPPRPSTAPHSPINLDAFQFLKK